MFKGPQDILPTMSSGVSPAILCNDTKGSSNDAACGLLLANEFGKMIATN
jgi:hypothetical protein